MNKTIHLKYGEETIPVACSPKKSGKNCLLIKVHPNCQVEIKIPRLTSENDVLQALQKRAPWIHKQIHRFRSQSQDIVARNFVSGESHLYLGKQYLLKVETGPDASVTLLRDQIVITTPSPSSVRAEEMLNLWYKKQAKEVFQSRILALIPRIDFLKTPPPVYFRFMRTQWGSCSSKGRISLNPHLVKAPLECIDYVILHEVCHLKELNHSPRFYRLLSSFMPEWKTYKKHLDAMALRIIPHHPNHK